MGIGENKRNDATIEYQILDMATNKSVLEMQESASKLNPNADQLTLEKTMPLAGLEPGKYQVTIKVNDGILKQTINQSAPFIVEQREAQTGLFERGQVKAVQPIFRRTRSQATQDTTAIAASTM